MDQNFAPDGLRALTPSLSLPTPQEIIETAKWLVDQEFETVLESSLFNGNRVLFATRGTATDVNGGPIFTGQGFVHFRNHPKKHILHPTVASGTDLNFARDFFQARFNQGLFSVIEKDPRSGQTGLAVFHPADYGDWRGDPTEAVDGISVIWEGTSKEGGGFEAALAEIAQQPAPAQQPRCINKNSAWPPKNPS